jgi:hypothetical protein
MAMEQIAVWPVYVFVACNAFFALMLPMMSRSIVQVTPHMWWDGDGPQRVVLRIVVVLTAVTLTFMCACYALLALTGGMERLKELAPAAFKFGIIAGIVFNAIIACGEMIEKSMKKPEAIAR